MKKIVLTVITVITFASIGNAQKFGFIDTEYILNNIPAFTAAQEQLDKLSSQYQKELETMYAEIEKMYQNYQNESSSLSDAMKRRREDAIITKEKDYKQLQSKYFGPNGDLFTKRQSLVQPIQDAISKAVQEIANAEGYATIFDKAESNTLFYTNPCYDLSDQVLQKLGYK